MKKIIASLLLFSLLISLCACVKSEPQIRGEIKTESSDIPTDAPQATTPDKDEPATDPTESAETQDASSTETAPAEADTSDAFSLGTVRQNVYENPFIGLGCKLGSEWTFYNDEQIRQLNNLAIELGGEELAQWLKDAPIVYDMYAVIDGQYNNININLEKANNLQILSLDLKENAKLLAPMMEETLKNIGYSDVHYKVGSADVAGKQLTALYGTATLNDVNMYQVQFQKKCNGYIATVTATTYFNDTTKDIIDCFYWLS